MPAKSRYRKVRLTSRFETVNLPKTPFPGLTFNACRSLPLSRFMRTNRNPTDPDSLASAPLAQAGRQRRTARSSTCPHSSLLGVRSHPSELPRR